jgi:hypothetical protein
MSNESPSWSLASEPDAPEAAGLSAATDEIMRIYGER